MKTHRQLLGCAALVGATLLWSGSFVVARALHDEVSPVALNYLRWVLAAALLLVLFGRGIAAARRALRREWKLVVAAGLTGMAAFHTCMFYALQHTGALNAVLILSLSPVAILSISWLATGKAIGPAQAIGAGVSLVGAAWLVVRGDPSALAGLQVNRGDAWMLAGVALWAAYSVLLQRRPADLAPGVLLAASAAAGVALMTPLYAFELARGAAGLSLNAGVLGGILYLGLGGAVVAFFLWSRGVAAVGAATAGQFLHLLPLFGAVLAVVLLGERIAPYHFAGALLIFAGIACTQSFPFNWKSS